MKIIDMNREFSISAALYEILCELSKELEGHKTTYDADLPRDRQTIRHGVPVTWVPCDDWRERYVIPTAAALANAVRSTGLTVFGDPIGEMAESSLVWSRIWSQVHGVAVGCIDHSAYGTSSRRWWRRHFCRKTASAITFYISGNNGVSENARPIEEFNSRHLPQADWAEA